MSASNFKKCLSIMLKWEGGTVDHPDDPGGFTSRGVTAASGRRHRARQNLKPKAVNLWSSGEVKFFYKKEYWDKVQGDALPSGVDLATFDYGVNSGPSRSAKVLQRILNVNADGVIGPKTLGALDGLSAASVAKKVCQQRLRFVQGLSTFRVFGRGWSRRIADIEAKSVQMAGSSVVDMGADALKAVKDAQAGQKHTTVTLFGTIATTIVTHGDLLIMGGVLVLGGFLAFVLWKKSEQQKERAEAYYNAIKSP